MKKTIFTSLITSFVAILLLGAPAFAQTAADLTASATKDLTVKEPVVVKEVTLETKTLIKADPLTIKRQKIEADLRATIVKLGVVIERTQTLIDLLNKNERDTTEASSYLVDARTSLQNAVDSLNQFAGVIAPEVKVETRVLQVTEKVVPAVIKPTPASLKEALKKAEDSLKESKAFIISSINSLKESLATKESQ